MTVLYTNKFSQSVATALTTSATTLVLDSYTGLPAIGGGDTCRLTIENGADSEIVLATATGGSGLTITRAQEGTTALAFNTSSTVENRATALDYEEATKYTGETRAIDFGDAASFEIPNATASTTNAAGEIALNTSGDVTNVTSATIQAHNGTSNYYFFGTTAYPTTAGDTLQLSTSGTIVWAATAAGSSAVEDLTNMTESTEFNTGDGISFDDHSFILSGNPYLTNGGAELVTNSYQYRKYGWQNVSSVIYPQIVGSGTGNYFGFTSNGPRMVNGARSVQLLTTGFESAGDIFPSADSSFDLGTSSKAFAQIYGDDLFANSTLTVPNGSAPTVDAAGEIAVDTTITDHTGLITYHDGTEALYGIGIPTANLTTTDGHVIAYNATNNEFEMVAQSGGGGASALGDLSDVTTTTVTAASDGVDFDNYRFLGSGNPSVTNGGITLYSDTSSSRLYGWETVNSLPYPKMVGSASDEYIGFTSSGTIIQTTTSASIEVTSTQTNIIGDIVPGTDSSFDLGTASKAFASVYIDELTVNTTLTRPTRYFRASRSTAQSIATSTVTKVQLTTEESDDDNIFDNVTNYRATPDVAGKYLIIGSTGIQSLSDAKYIVTIINKNGSSVSEASNYISTSGGVFVQCVAILDMNGTTDYVELAIFHNEGNSENTQANAAKVYLEGFLL